MLRTATLMFLLTGVFLLAGLAGGCIKVRHVSNCYEKPRAGLGLQPGQRVVARWRNGFYEGTVITVQGRLVTVAWDEPPPERSALPRGWIQALENQEDLSPGAPAVCGAESGWALCLIKGIKESAVTATSARSGAEEIHPNDRVVPVPAGLRPWAKRLLARQLERHKLTQEIKPGAPLGAGAAVTAEQRVLALWSSGGWWEATVRAVDGERVTVTWADGSGEATLPPSSVTPLPPATPPKAGQLAYCKWASSLQWYAARVDRAAAAGLEVTYQDGEKAKLGPQDCLPASR